MFQSAHRSFVLQSSDLIRASASAIKTKGQEAAITSQWQSETSKSATQNWSGSYARSSFYIAGGDKLYPHFPPILQGPNASLDTHINIHTYGLCQSTMHVKYVKYVIYDIFDIYDIWHLRCIYISKWVKR